MTWLRSVESLARSHPAEVTDAQLQLRELVRLARALAPAVVVHPPGAHDPASPCPVVGPHADALCALVPRLAALDVHAAPARLPVDAVLGLFREAVADAGDIVRWCRQTAHPGGGCWFVSSHDGTGCGEVLKLSHLLAG